MATRRNKSFPIFIRDLEVLEAYDVTPLMRRVVLGGDQLGAFVNNGFDVAPFATENADDHVKIVIGRPGTDFPVPGQEDGHLDWSRAALDRARDYTPRRFDPVAGRLEIDFVRHVGGLAATWADEVAPGERVLVAGPRGTTVLPDDIGWHFLLGDETALPAIARRIEELPAGTPVTAVVTIPTASEQQSFSHDADLDITWVIRDQAPAGTPWEDLVMDAARRAPWREGTVYAWAAGEADMLRPVRRWLKNDKQVPRTHVDIAGYWRKGTAQNETGELADKLEHEVSLAVPYAARAAISLDLAEHIIDGADTIPALAAAAGASVAGVRKVVKVLSYSGLFLLGADDTVRLGPLGALLTEDFVHARFDHRSGYARLDDAWPGLLHAVTTGEPGYPVVVGQTLWETLAADQRLGETFDQTLGAWAGIWCRAAASALELTTEHVVDVGGGAGELLGELLESAPGLRGTLVDLPSSAARGHANLSERGLGERVEVAPQTFFEELPAGDVYTLAQVLRNWPDAEAELILRRVAEAARAADARIAVIECISGPDAHDHDAEFDLLMYATFGAGERTLAEYADLASRAGLEVVASSPLTDDLHLFELRPA